MKDLPILFKRRKERKKNSGRRLFGLKRSEGEGNKEKLRNFKTIGIFSRYEKYKMSKKKNIEWGGGRILRVRVITLKVYQSGEYKNRSRGGRENTLMVGSGVANRVGRTKILQYEKKKVVVRPKGQSRSREGLRKIQIPNSMFFYHRSAFLCYSSQIKP